MRYISGSSLKTFRECPRRGYLRYLSGPFGDSPTLGLEEPRGNPHLSLGIAWHLAAEKLLAGEGGLTSFTFATEQLSPEDRALLGEVEMNWLLAACLAWERSKADEFAEKWEIVGVEQEIEVPLTPNVTLYTRADAVLKDRGDGSVWVLNWKTASDVKDWNRKWFYEPQAWTESLAVESKLGVPVAGCIFLGVWKGPAYMGKTTSRLLYGFKYQARTGLTYATENNGGGVRFEASKEKFPFGEGLGAWISWLPEDILKKHFVESAPQIRQDTLVEKWLRQLVRNEHDIDHILSTGSEADREEFFWQNWGEETCGRCPFKDICMLRASPEDMIKEGLLRPRRRSPRDEAAGRGSLPSLP
jgi:hypothetical protein